MWKYFADYLSFHRRERRGVLLLLALCAVFLFLILIDPWLVRLPEYEFSEFPEIPRKTEKPGYREAAAPPAERGTELFGFDPNEVTVRELRRLGLSGAQASSFVDYREKYGSFRREAEVKDLYVVSDEWYDEVKGYMTIDGEGSLPEKFPFDPNTVSRDSLKLLGLSEGQAKSWINFRRAGGYFEKKEDIAELYALDSVVAAELSEFTVFRDKDEKADTATFTKIDINTADTSGLREVPGIGPVLSARIVKYRELLWNFTEAEQLAEVYGIDSSDLPVLLQYVKVSEAPESRDINRISADSLRSHPYVGKDLAHRILEFRREVRPLRNLEELKRLGLKDENIMSKIANYFTASPGASKGKEKHGFYEE